MTVKTSQQWFFFLILLFLHSKSWGALENKPHLVCYVGSWATYRPSIGQFSIDDVDPLLCTHLIYAFAGLDNETNEIRSVDPFLDLATEGGKGWYDRAVNLKAVNPRLKVLVAIGGWNEGSKKYSKMAMSLETRQKFVSSVIRFLKEHRFDGLDLDWEYPARRGGEPFDKANFILLLRDLRSAFREYGYLLTVAVGASVYEIETSYDVPAMSQEVDLVNIMAYDYHGPWDKYTGLNAPLYHRGGESEKDRKLNVATTVQKYIDLGADPSKLVLGLPLYGRSYILKRDTEFDLGAPAESIGFEGAYTREAGFLSYLEICLLGNRGTWSRVIWEVDQEVPYLVNGTRWVSYDDPSSLTKKVQFANQKNLAGVMVWSLDNDDFAGRCGEGRYPLLSSIRSALQEWSLELPRGNALERTGNAAVSERWSLLVLLTTGFAALFILRIH